MYVSAILRVPTVVIPLVKVRVCKFGPSAVQLRVPTLVRSGKLRDETAVMLERPRAPPIDCRVAAETPVMLFVP